MLTTLSRRPRMTLRSMRASVQRESRNSCLPAAAPDRSRGPPSPSPSASASMRHGRAGDIRKFPSGPFWTGIVLRH